jgi:hypothetical protein
MVSPTLPTIVLTKAITTIIPTKIPTRVPTKVPKPTTLPIPTPKKRTPNYSEIAAMVANPPVIGCQFGISCNLTGLYNTSVMKGIGYATYYGDENSTGYNVVADVIHNLKRISMDQALKFIKDNYMVNQSEMTPEEAKATKKVVAFAATRTCKDQWKIKYLFGIDDPKNPSPYFIGRVMIMDCASEADWNDVLAQNTYSYKGWSKLNWIIDLSKNGFIQLPTGLTGNKNNVGEGRPGVVMIDESILDSIIY